MASNCCSGKNFDRGWTLIPWFRLSKGPSWIWIATLVGSSFGYSLGSRRRARPGWGATSMFRDPETEMRVSFSVAQSPRLRPQATSAVNWHHEWGAKSVGTNTRSTITRQALALPAQPIRPPVAFGQDRSERAPAPHSQFAASPNQTPSARRRLKPRIRALPSVQTASSEVRWRVEAAASKPHGRPARV